MLLRIAQLRIASCRATLHTDALHNLQIGQLINISIAYMPEKTVIAADMDQ